MESDNERTEGTREREMEMEMKKQEGEMENLVKGIMYPTSIRVMAQIAHENLAFV